MGRQAPGSGSSDDEEPQHIVDEDGDVSTEADICTRCDCARNLHEDGKGECAGCGSCNRFRST
jgi:hypothetical protein